MVELALTSTGLVCSALAALGVGLLFLPRTPGRLAYYALVAEGSTPRLAALASAGCLLSAVATLRSSRFRKLALVATGTGGLCAELSTVLAAAVFRAARARGLPVSVTEGMFGTHLPPSAAPELVTFSTGQGWRLDADVYRPLNAGGRDRSLPSVVVVHGGAWRWGDKGENTTLNRWLAARGYLVLDIQYRLAPMARWDQAVGDIQAALAWLRAHAAELGADPGRVALLGRSAGGQLALLAAYGGDDRPPWRVIALYAPADLTRLYTEARGGQAQELRDGLRASLGGSPSSASQTYRMASPVERVHAGAPPTLLIHGAWDAVVPPCHSAILAGALMRAGVPVESILVPYARHAFDLISHSLTSQLAAEVVAAFLSSPGGPSSG